MSLNGQQWRFIAARLLANSDKEAAEAAGVAYQTCRNWKSEDPEFLREYEASFTDGVEVAKNFTRKLLGKAASVLDDALSGRDSKARLRAVELIFKTHGLLRERVEWAPDLSGISAEDLQRLDTLLGRISGTSGKTA